MNVQSAPDQLSKSVQARADRYMYVPLVGLSVMLAFGVWEFVAKRRPARVAALLAGAALLLGFAGASWVQAGHWRDDRALFEQASEIYRRLLAESPTDGGLYLPCPGSTA